MNHDGNFFGLFPYSLTGELPCDMICSCEETAAYMVGELNAGRFWNVPSFQGINCNAVFWVYRTLHPYAGFTGFTAWFDPLNGFVHATKPSLIRTYKIVLNHHYADGLSIGSRLLC